MLNQDFNGRGAIRNTFFESADLALNRRTVTFEGTIAAEEVKLAMAPVTLMIGRRHVGPGFDRRSPERSTG